MTDVVTKSPTAPLYEHARNVHSQFGEDGIIERILEVIGDVDGWCVEFGAWDGVYLSNTHYLTAEKDYSAVLIEADPVKFQELEQNCRGNDRLRTVCAFVGFQPQDGLDPILARTPIPRTFDLLSIDIDGNDYHTWKSASVYRPKVVVIEFNPTIPNEVHFVQPADPSVSQGSSIRAMVELGRAKGYELVAATTCNAIFVAEEYLSRFEMVDNSIEALRRDLQLVTYMFQGLDGTILISGCDRLIWHELPFDVNRLQQLPRLFRRYPYTLGPVRSVLFKIYHRLRTLQARSQGR